MERTQIILLILAAGVLPLVWGWGVNWFIDRVWPRHQPRSSRSAAESASPPPVDYQI